MENSQLKKMTTTSSSKSLVRSNSQGLKIPKILLVKSMQKRNQKSNAEDFEAGKIKNKKKSWAKLPTNLFPKKVGSIISHVFGKQKSEETKILKCRSLKEILETEDNEQRREKACCSKSLQLWKDEKMQTLKVMGVNCRKVKRVRSVKNRVMKLSAGKSETGEGKKGGNEKEKKGDEELCKKRILMGGKCRPLNVSGALHYDQNGILLPEDVLP